MVQYRFSRFADENAVLIFDDETIYTNIYLSPNKILPISSIEEQKHYMGKIDGRNILIVGSQVIVLSDTYTVYVVHDITSIYYDITQMIWQFATISLVGIAIGVLLIVLLVRYATKPLKKLGISARRIANGEYAERAHIFTHDEVGALAEDFNVMAKAIQYHITELEETAQKQQLFIGGLTHEFKTPLTSVIGHSETLLYTKMPDDVVINSLTHIHEQCKWLERLTQKLLALITLQKEIDLKEESVDELLKIVKNDLGETLLKRKINLEISCEVDTLPMDSDLMQSLLINLVDNAAKASKSGQTVIVRAYDHIIEVIDNGIESPKKR